MYIIYTISHSAVERVTNPHLHFDVSDDDMMRFKLFINIIIIIIFFLLTPQTVKINTITIALYYYAYYYYYYYIKDSVSFINMFDLSLV